MKTLEELRNALPEYAKDIKLNLQSVMQSEHLSQEQCWGVAVTSAAVAGDLELLAAVRAEAEGKVSAAVLDDALAAAVLMGMNNVYYRFRHLVEKDSYQSFPARLRMNRIAKPASTKLDFELFCLAASAINACQACIQSHENVVTSAGLSEEGVHDAVRIASTVTAAAKALALASM